MRWTDQKHPPIEQVTPTHIIDGVRWYRHYVNPKMKRLRFLWWFFEYHACGDVPACEKEHIAGIFRPMFRWKVRWPNWAIGEVDDDGLQPPRRLDPIFYSWFILWLEIRWFPRRTELKND